METADGLVERLGVSGLHPDVQRAAGRVAEAYAAQDTNAFTARLSEFEALVQELAFRPQT